MSKLKDSPCREAEAKADKDRYKVGKSDSRFGWCVYKNTSSSISNIKDGPFESKASAISECKKLNDFAYRNGY